jgi:hypothetical protein
MATNKITTSKSYKGGHIKREAATGRLVEVTTARGTSKATARSERVVSKTVAKRGAALRRLADR